MPKPRFDAGIVRHATTPNLGELMGAMPKMMEGMKKLPELQKTLKEMPSEGSALDGQVKVTLSGDLAPLAVEIDETLMKRDRKSVV